MIYLVSNQMQLFNNNDIKNISIEESLQLLKDCKILQYDSETSGKDPHIAKLLCIQFGNKEKDFQIVIDCTTVDVLIYKDILESKYIIGQNLKFDLQFLYNYDIIPLKVYDTMIVEQLLYLGYPSGIIRYSLKDIANRYLNIDIDKSVRGEIIWRGLDIEVIKYAAGDVMYLEDIMHLQIQECKKKDCLKGAKLECDVVPAMAYLEWCGIKLDAEKWKSKMKNDKIRLDKAIKDLNNFILQDPNLSDFTYVDTQLDLFGYNDLQPKCTINWASPSQVVKLAKKLGFNTVVIDKKTKEEKDSVLEKVLSKQKGINDTFLKLYFEYKEADKVVTSFGQSQLNMINPITGRCHTVYKQLGAASGRMSCGSDTPNTDLAKLKKINPKECTYCNFQQLPANEETRSAFVAEKGNLFCSCDWSSLEARLGADIYNEPMMLHEYLYGAGDQHSLVAKLCFKELKDVDVHDIKKLRPDLRKKAKPIGFSMQFGGSAYAVADSLQCSIEEAQELVDNYMKGFKGINEFKNKGSKEVRSKGYVLINKYTGHKMYWWDHDKWLERQKSFTPEFWEEYRLHHKGTKDNIALMVKEHFQAASKWDRMALNAPTQGTGSNCMKLTMTRLFKYIIDNKLFRKVKIVAIVHDEACIEYPKTLPEMSNILKDTMEKAASEFCKKLPIPAEAAVGNYWIH